MKHGTNLLTWRVARSLCGSWAYMGVAVLASESRRKMGVSWSRVAGWFFLLWVSCSALSFLIVQREWLVETCSKYLWWFSAGVERCDQEARGDILIGWSMSWRLHTPAPPPPLPCYAVIILGASGGRAAYYICCSC